MFKNYIDVDSCEVRFSTPEELYFNNIYSSSSRANKIYLKKKYTIPQCIAPVLLHAKYPTDRAAMAVQFECDQRRNPAAFQTGDKVYLRLQNGYLIPGNHRGYDLNREPVLSDLTQNQPLDIPTEIT